MTARPQDPHRDLSAEIGTFRESRSAPVHRWFRYPAGFSPGLVRWALGRPGAPTRPRVVDPFAGSGTTLVACREAGVPSVGIEAHPLVHWIATVKTRWDLDVEGLRPRAEAWARATPVRAEDRRRAKALPDLLARCFEPGPLAELVALRDALPRRFEDRAERELLTLALLDALRDATTAGSGWPYIAPAGDHHGKEGRPVRGAVQACVARCLDDLADVQARVRRPWAPCRVLAADSRTVDLAGEGPFSLSVSSPPYLNNYDYADRTRLELYFLGWETDWSGITRRVRSRLLPAATTQVRAGGGAPAAPENLAAVAPGLARRLHRATDAMYHRSRARAGRKRYDLMTAGYFEGLTAVLANLRDHMRTGARLYWVLGDSAPYGVHVPTETWIGEIARSLGYRRSHVATLRTRGGKWAMNPQRHQVPLRESLLTLTR